MVLTYILLALVPFFAHAEPTNLHETTRTFAEPIDGISVTFETTDGAGSLQYFAGDTWSNWQDLAVENEQDPSLTESNLLVFPTEVKKIRIRATQEITIHPIRIDDAFVSYQTAALGSTVQPRILSRRDWGADESLLVRKGSASSSSTQPQEATSTEGTPSERVSECNTAQLNFPGEFKTKNHTTTNENGEALRWTRDYSPEVTLLVVHHTAMGVSSDTRSGAERVRALYEYHANSRGWGDIGYHYLVDENGRIYEGKSGGDYVVGGHAYCNNIGTIGIALLGNFEEEKPTQDQLKALQWLLKELADRYNIDPTSTTTFHGKRTEPIVGHRDLLSTACPGYYVYGSLSQIRTHVAQNDVFASVTLPRTIASTKQTTVKDSLSRRAERAASRTPTAGTSRAVQRVLNTQASRTLLNKLKNNIEGYTSMEERRAARAAARGGAVSSQSSSRSSVRTVQTSSRTRVSLTRSSSASSDSSESSDSSIIIRLTRQETGATNCGDYDLSSIRRNYRGTVTCQVIDGIAALLNTVDLEDYMLGLAEEPDTEPYEKQRAFAIAARTYAAYYSDPNNLRKFPGKPYDGSDSPATFQLYGGITFEKNNPRWVAAVHSTANEVLTKNNTVIRPPYFSASDGTTKSPTEAGWNNFPFAEIFSAKDDHWCAGMTQRGHGVGMSGCGAKGQANEGKTGEEILAYYYPTTLIQTITQLRSSPLAQRP